MGGFVAFVDIYTGQKTRLGIAHVIAAIESEEPTPAPETPPDTGNSPPVEAPADPPTRRRLTLITTDYGKANHFDGRAGSYGVLGDDQIDAVLAVLDAT